MTTGSFGPAPVGSVAETIEVVTNQKHLSRYARLLARQARTVSRRQRGSRRHHQAQLRLAKTHAIVARSSRDSLHKLTARLAATCGEVARAIPLSSGTCTWPAW